MESTDGNQIFGLISVIKPRFVIKFEFILFNYNFMPTILDFAILIIN